MLIASVAGLKSRSTVMVTVTVGRHGQSRQIEVRTHYCPAGCVCLQSCFNKRFQVTQSGGVQNGPHHFPKYIKITKKILAMFQVQFSRGYIATTRIDNMQN